MQRRDRETGKPENEEGSLMNWTNLCICLKVYGILLSEYSIGLIALVLIIIGFFLLQIFRTKDPVFSRESYREKDRKNIY